MKSLSIFVTLIICAFSFTSVNAIPPGASTTITGFWVDVSVISGYVNAGAVNLKIYAATDDAGSNCNAMVGLDGSGNYVGQAYKVDSKGICPPSCEFTGMSTAGGAAMDIGKAAGYVSNYMAVNQNARNCAKFTMSSLYMLRTSCVYVYVSVSSSGSATANGYAQDGTACSKASAVGTAVTEPMR